MEKSNTVFFSECFKHFKHSYWYTIHIRICVIQKKITISAGLSELALVSILHHNIVAEQIILLVLQINIRSVRIFCLLAKQSAVGSITVSQTQGFCRDGGHLCVAFLWFYLSSMGLMSGD